MSLHFLLQHVTPMASVKGVDILMFACLEFKTQGILIL